MRILFTFLSVGYVATIFLFADSPMVSDMSTFNPYSLLHIPLYAILTFLITFSLVPIRLKLNNPINPTNQINLSREMRRLFHWDATNPKNYLIISLVAIIIGIADEIHQSFIPARDASVTDVFLDFIGIALTLFIIIRYNKKWLAIL